jgi:hypothetical protein
VEKGQLPGDEHRDKDTAKHRHTTQSWGGARVNVSIANRGIELVLESDAQHDERQAKRDDGGHDDHHGESDHD